MSTTPMDPVEQLRACIAEDAVNLEKARTWIGPVWHERAGLRRRIAELEHHLAGVGEPQATAERPDERAIAALRPPVRAAVRTLGEIDDRRDRDDGPLLKARLDLGIGREMERTVRLRVEVDGGYSSEDLLVVHDMAARQGARLTIQNGALELHFDQLEEPTRAVRVEWCGQAVGVDVVYPDGTIKSVGNLAFEAAEKMGAHRDPPTSYTLHGVADPNGIRILDGALAASALEPGGTYQLVLAG